MIFTCLKKKTPCPKREVHKLQVLEALQSNAPSLGGANVITI